MRTDAVSLCRSRAKRAEYKQQIEESYVKELCKQIDDALIAGVKDSVLVQLDLPLNQIQQLDSIYAPYGWRIEFYRMDDENYGPEFMIQVSKR